MADARKDFEIKSQDLLLPVKRYEESDTPSITDAQQKKDDESPIIGKLLEQKEKEKKQYGKRTPVLMLHGASAASQTFEFPNKLHLSGFLLKYTNLEPWLLDWRGSRNVTEDLLGRKDFDEHFDFRAVAEHDIPSALSEIRNEFKAEPEVPIRVMAHCMGAASLSIALAAGFLQSASIRPTRVVLSTIGLFYEVAIDGRLKASDHLLERVLTDMEKDPAKQKLKFIDPTTVRKTVSLRNEWPEELEALYEIWPGWIKPHEGAETGEDSEASAELRSVEAMCNRVSFMYGEPYYEPSLRPEIHEDPEELRIQFGSIPLRMYVHAAQSVRRGWVADFDASLQDRSYINSIARKNFEDIDITLITGDMNRLWHRDSVDRMYEWLRRANGKGRYRKIIFKGYGHQDLYWGKNSWNEVFPRIAEALTL